MDTDGPARTLTTAECWDRVAAARIGRLATSVFDEIDIAPISAVLSQGELYFRSEPGSKLGEIAANPQVAFQVDGHDETSTFSVVVKGTAERLHRQTDIDAAESLPLAPRTPSRYRWVRIRPESVTGRAFPRAHEPGVA
jgi:nitroimidazol reductase NimA-like FMN-containing flavoprotein (pyridoxamine 5'-phosphate oxidase superfamily)